METSHDGEIDHPCSGHGVARPAGVSRISDVRVRINIRRDPDLREAIGIPAFQGARVTIGLQAPIDLQGVGPRVAQDALAAIGHPVLLDPRAAIAPRTDLGVPANTGRSCPRSTRQAEGVRYSAARPSHWLDETFFLLPPTIARFLIWFYVARRLKTKSQ